nr:helix-turn-helix domain-containing protein [Streptomyces sp. QL37]PPQ59274.1 DNA-directed RNA polymerase sigma-70 factor [Streptomyces sp. QL37]
MTRSATGQAPAAPLPSPKERRRLREARALSEEQVATAVGVTPATVRAWETGRTSPRGRRRTAYARLIGCAEPRPAPPPSVEATGSSPMSPTEPHTVVEQQGAPVRGRQGEQRVEQRPPRRVLGQRVGPAVGAAKPVPGRHGVLVRRRPHPAPGIAVPGHLGPALPGDPEGVFDGFPGELPAAGQQVHLTGETRRRAPVQRVVRLLGGEARAGLRGGTAPGASAPDERVPAPQPRAGLTAEEAYDALYGRTAPGLTRQMYLLTGRRKLAREAVEHAFRIAWQRWPEVARDRDPGGWVRAASYEYAMSPWHRLRRAHRRPDALPEDPARRALLDALLALPPSYRRTLLLHDGVGLGLPETAAETEASTPATASRLLNARAAVAERLPGASEPTEPGGRPALHDPLGALALAEEVPEPPAAPAVRAGSERIAELWTRAALCFGVLLIGTTAFTLHTAPTQYEQPLAPAERVGGVPPRGGPEKLTPQDLKLQKSLRGELTHGPERLVPRIP